MPSLLNIAIVEDHEVLLEVLVETLRREGHSVIGLTCAEAIDDEGAHQPIDLLILDLGLPGEDGLSLARRFRAAQPHAFIVMLTARTSLSDRVQGYAHGADIYLPKPVEPAELVAVVQSIARRAESGHESDEPASSHMLTLQVSWLTVEGLAGSVKLTRAEAIMLAAFARAPGQVLESWQIMEFLGEDPETYARNGLEARIARLRSKLLHAGSDGGCIRSIRSSGYQLCVRIRVL